MPSEKYTPGYVFQESDIPITGMRFLGFVSMLDPPRASVPEAIKKCREAGIKVTYINVYVIFLSFKINYWMNIYAEKEFLCFSFTIECLTCIAR